MHGCNDIGVRMAEAEHAVAAEEIEEYAALVVGDLATLGRNFNAESCKTHQAGKSGVDVVGVSVDHQVIEGFCAHRREYRRSEEFASVPLSFAEVASDTTDRPNWAQEKHAVRMLDGLLGGHAGNLQRAMNRTSDRFGVLSQNLANVNTPGYKRKDMDFGIELEQSMERGQLRLRDRADGGLRTFSGSIRTDGNSVNLEEEVSAIAETETRYRLLSEMSSRYFTGLKNVIREGR